MDCSNQPQTNEYSAYIHYRASLFNTYQKLNGNKQLKVVYFGGSLTAGYGSSDTEVYSWRAKIGAWLAQSFPHATIRNVSRAMGESGTYMGAHRLSMDVISAKPDLLFVEYSINDFYYKSSYEQAASQYETLIREVKQALPDTDIVTVLVTDQKLLEINREGKLHAQAQAHEDISKIYHIPTIHVGRCLASFLNYSAEAWGDYAIDRVHLNDAGYEIYYRVIREFLYNSLFLTDFSKPQDEFVMSAVVSERLFDGNRTYMLPSQELLESSEALGGIGVTWTNESCFSNARISDCKGRFQFHGDSDMLAIRFCGTEICAYEFKCDVAWLVSVDGGEYQTVKGTSHNPVIFAQGLASGEHVVRIKSVCPSGISIGAIFTRDATLATVKGTA